MQSLIEVSISLLNGSSTKAFGHDAKPEGVIVVQMLLPFLH